MRRFPCRFFDRHGRYPEFVEHFHKMFARSQNTLRGRWENFWSSEQVCVVRLVNRDDVMDKLVYTATNPVKDGLVDKVHHWPGVNGLGALLAGRPLRADRPYHLVAPARVCIDRWGVTPRLDHEKPNSWA